MLGEPIGPEVQRCIGRCIKYNDIMTTLFASSLAVELPKILGLIETGLGQVKACIADTEHAWGMAADVAHEPRRRGTPEHQIFVLRMALSWL